MGLWLGSWFGIGLDVLQQIVKINEEKIELYKKANEEKFARKIERLLEENEKIKAEIERREKAEEME